MNSELIKWLVVLIVVLSSMAIILTCVDAVLTVWASRYTRTDRFAMALRWLGWRWNSLQWKLANIRFDISVWLTNKKAGF